ncbi:MAG: serine dehydratase subunit alpha family protein [Bacillota bacterium]
MFTLKEFLQAEVKPALGCTEPAAVALATARAYEELDITTDELTIEVEVSNSIYKNGMVVGIPGTDGARGNVIAAVLGVLCGQAEYGLEVLQDCTTEDVTTAREWVEDDRVRVECDYEEPGVYIKAVVKGSKHQATAIIREDHSQIVEVSKDGQVVSQPVGQEDDSSPDEDQSVPEQIKELTYAQLLDLVAEIDQEDIDYLWQGVKMNMEMAEIGLDNEYNSGLNIGNMVDDLMERGVLSADLGYQLRSYAAAASDARMSGVPLPIMSSAGSGNHGITAILPVAIVGQEHDKSEEKIAKALAISHLTTSFVKSKTGRLSPICGCAIAAGTGAATGITYLLGGETKQLKEAIQIMLSNVAGMVCDGAKETCALKVATASSEAYMSALLALEGCEINIPQGVVGDTVEETTDNVDLVNRTGMEKIDDVVIEILEKSYGS